MKKITFVLVIGILVLFVYPTASHAGPWTLEQGRTWFEVFTRYSHSKYNFGPDGNVSRWDNGGSQDIWDIEGKLEYGLTDKFNLLLYVPYSWNTFKNDFVRYGSSQELKNEGFKNVQIGGKYKFLDKPFVAAAQLKFFVMPFNTNRNKEPLLDEWGNALELRGIVGKSFTVFERPGYVSVESGIKFRSKRWIGDSDWANTVPIFAEFGISPHDRVMIKNEFDCVISLPHTGRRKDTYTYRVGPIINLLGKGFSAVYRGEDKSLNVEFLYGFTFAGRSDGSIQHDRSWPNSDDRVGKFHEYICKVQLLF
ncbi:MAG: hypothetical protein PVH45_01450 [Candidatus Omnitrophota bacterium]|jgi:hypothetical protein